MSLILLVGCAKPPYEGVSALSYGQLANYQDASTKASVSVPRCDPDDQIDLTHELARRITGAILSPVGGMTNIHPSILKEELQDNFKMPGDFGEPNVLLLERTPQRIVFWYHGDVVTLQEVGKAASAYCKHSGAQAFYEGSARRCSEPKLMPVVVNGKRTMIETYAISSFQCVVPIIPGPARQPAKKKLAPT